VKPVEHSREKKQYLEEKINELETEHKYYRLIYGQRGI
jgi:hypothetical protein